MVKSWNWNSTLPLDYRHKGPVMRRFWCLFEGVLIRLLNKQSSWWGFGVPQCSCDIIMMKFSVVWRGSSTVPNTSKYPWKDHRVINNHWEHKRLSKGSGQRRGSFLQIYVMSTSNDGRNLVYEQFSLQPAHPCFKIDHVGSSGKFPYMFPVYMVITSENKKIIWKVVFKMLTFFAKIRALFRHLCGRNADIW